MRAIANVNKLSGIKGATGDLRSVTVTFDPQRVSAEEIAEAIEGAGPYRVTGMIVREKGKDATR